MRTGHAISVGPRVHIAFWAVMAAWGAGVVMAAQSGWLGALGEQFMPGYAMLVALGIALPTAAWFRFAAVRRVVDTIGLHRLTLLHIWRIPAALLFFHYGNAGQLPTAFWMLAGIGDFLAGSLAATLLWLRPTPRLYKAIHLFGFLDFVVAVGTGLTFTLLGDPGMVLLTTLPMALIPLFGVGLSGASHIIALRMLFGDRRNEVSRSGHGV